jgi:DNA-binding response OmpR family regulator
MENTAGASPAHPCVLLVEDEMCLAMMLQDLLEDAGYRVLKAARVPAALSMAEGEDIDAAILDVNVAGREVFPVADELRRRGVPFMFASGYGDRGVPGEFREYPMLQKPYDPAALGTMLKNVLASPGVRLS